jgi:hypothetical protein
VHCLARAGPVFLDVSKQRIDERVMSALLALADAMPVEARLLAT